MSYQPRHRSALRRSKSAVALAASGLVAGTALMLLSGTANADSTSAPDTVTFSGNCPPVLAVSASSVPDPSTMSVPEGDKVTIVNKLGVSATPQVDGTSLDPVANGGSMTYPATDAGTVDIKMIPKTGLLSCSVLGVLQPVKTNYQPVTLTVTAPSPSPSGSESSGGSTGSGDQGSSSHGSSGHGSSPTGHKTSGDDSAAKPPAHHPAAGESPAPDPTQPAARGAVPSSAADPGSESGTSGGGGEPSGSDPAPVPRAVSDTGPSSATSVLALIAAVCLFGVGAVAVRTVLAQRRQFGKTQHT